MHHLKIPQTRDELNTSIIDHPITEVAYEKVIKDIRSMSSKKKDLENEQQFYCCQMQVSNLQ